MKEVISLNFLKKRKNKDILLASENRWEIFAPVSLLILCLMSVIFIRSAQAYTGGNQWEMQVVWVIAGFLIYLVISLIDYHFWMRFAHITYAIGIASLFLVFMWPERYGAQRWIDLQFFKIQPSEFAKIVTLILGASILSRSEIGDMRDSLRNFKVSNLFCLSNVLDFHAT